MFTMESLKHYMFTNYNELSGKKKLLFYNDPIREEGEGEGWGVGGT